MTATNHALTGSLIGLVIGQPLIALPAALASHFLCDALPHFGSNLPEKIMFKSGWFRNYLIVEAFFCFIIVISLASVRPQHWILASICAFIAAAPDLQWANRYLKVRNNKKWRGGKYAKFAQAIQWFEHPVGAVVEIAWFLAATFIFLPFLR